MRFNEAGQPDHLGFAGCYGGGGKGGGGGGGGQSFSSGTSTTTLPDWVTNASQGALSTAQDLSQRPYDPYGGQIVAGTTADQQQAYQQIRDMQGAYTQPYQQAEGAWGNVLGNLQSLTPEQQNQATNSLFSNYGQQVLNPAAGLLGGYMSQGPATAQGVANNALQIMSPFSQAVIDPAMRAGQQALQQNLQQIGSAANQAGAFGGSRQGVTEGVAQSQAALGAGQYVGNLLNQGWQSALNPATQVALQGGQQGYGAAGTLTGLLAPGYQQAQASAQDMAGRNLQAGMTAAQQLPQVATAQQTADQKNASLLQTVGAAQQQQQQNELNAQMGQFYEQQNWPVQNLDVLLSTLGAIPYGSTTDWTQYGKTQPDAQKRNMLAGIGGGALSGAATGTMIAPGIGTAIGAVGGGILGALG